MLSTPIPSPDRNRSAASYLHSIDDDEQKSCSRLVRIEDWRFDELIAGTRRRQDAGELTLREGGGRRITIMAAHLQAIQKLRRPVPGRGLTARRAHASASQQSVNAGNPPVCTVTDDIDLIGKYPESTLVAV